MGSHLFENGAQTLCCRSTLRIVALKLISGNGMAADAVEKTRRRIAMSPEDPGKAGLDEPGKKWSQSFNFNINLDKSEEISLGKLGQP
jgi:hypothetical protein